MNRQARAPLAKTGVALILAGGTLLVLAVLGNAGCDFDTMNHCAAFGVWPAEPFVLQGVTGLVMLFGLASGGVGVILILARLVRPRR